MRPALLCAVAWAGCASAPPREPICATPAERAEIQQVQVGWQRLDTTQRRPAVDARAPTRDPRQAEDLALDLLRQCRAGAAMEPLQDRYSEAPGGSVVVGGRSNVPFRNAALCLQKDECALVHGDSAFHVITRIG
jgi:hypothetical protein